MGNQLLHRQLVYFSYFSDLKPIFNFIYTCYSSATNNSPYITEKWRELLYSQWIFGTYIPLHTKACDPWTYSYIDFNHFDFALPVTLIPRQRLHNRWKFFLIPILLVANNSYVDLFNFIRHDSTLSGDVNSIVTDNSSDCLITRLGGVRRATLAWVTHRRPSTKTVFSERIKLILMQLHFLSIWLSAIAPRHLFSLCFFFFINKGNTKVKKSKRYFSHSSYLFKRKVNHYFYTCVFHLQLFFTFCTALHFIVSSFICYNNLMSV